MPLDDFVGKTLKEVKEKLEQNWNSKQGLDYYRWLDYDHPVRNDECIDLQPMHPDPVLASLKVSEEGFRPDVSCETGDYIIRPGDVARFDAWRFFHAECYRRQLWKNCQIEFRQMFLDAGFKRVDISAEKLKLDDISNNLPEFCVVANGYFMKIGWTDGEGIKIEWEVSPGDRVIERFSEEQTEKSEGCIYANNRHTAAEYLKRIRKAFICVLDIG
jgi:hypothetical protein